MSLAALLTFCAALLAGAALPGPAVVAVVARVLGRGVSGTVPLVFGIVAGDVVWLTLALAGLSVVAQSFGALFALIRYAGAAYLLYLAWRLWTAPATIPDAPSEADRAAPPEGRLRLVLGGLALELGNPKTMVFYLALLPSLVDLAQVTVGAGLALVAAAVLVYGGVFAGYVLLAARSRRLLRSPRAVRAMNRGAGAVMAGAAVTVAAR